MDDVLDVLYIILLVAIFVAIGSFVYNNSAPSNLAPGDQVVLLTGQTVIQDGKPCQQSIPGFISPTGPDNENNWHKAERILFPFDEIVSFINEEGVISWEKESLIVKIPADDEILLCPTAEILE